MIVNETEKDKKQLRKMLIIAVLIIFLTFVLPFILFINSKHHNLNQNVIKQNSEISSQEENSAEVPLQKVNDVIDNSSIESEVKPEKAVISNIKRDLSDPFYSKIYSHMSKLKDSPYIELPYSYYPKDNYISNAASDDGKIHIFKKNPILIYVPENEYYDAVTQAFVSYNYRFKGLLSFKATNDPAKSDIKIIFTDDLSHLIDNKNTIGVGLAKKYDKDGNITYSELYVLNKKNSGYSANMISVYNVMLHEIGHCIGILGHSASSGDVMYKQEPSDSNSALRKFSQRDIETIILMYSGRNDIMSALLRNVKSDKLQENLLYAQANNNSDSYLSVADSYYNMEKYDEDLNSYKKAMELNPDNPKIYIKLAQSYIHAKKYDEAKKYLNISIKKVKNDEQKSMAYDNLGYISVMQKNYDEAVQNYYQSLKLQPNNQDEFFNYLEACYYANKKEDAKIAYNDYIQNFNSDNFDEHGKKLIEWVTK